MGSILETSVGSTDQRTMHVSQTKRVADTCRGTRLGEQNKRKDKGKKRQYLCDNVSSETSQLWRVQDNEFSTVLDHC
jgi:hypothetical protein